MEPSENSGSITVNTGANKPQLAIAWERERGGAMRVRARSVRPRIPPSEVREFLDQVNDRCRSGVMECIYRWGLLEYNERPPWRGELWLDDTLRLGPPSR